MYKKICFLIWLNNILAIQQAINNLSFFFEISISQRCIKRTKINNSPLMFGIELSPFKIQALKNMMILMIVISSAKYYFSFNWLCESQICSIKRKVILILFNAIGLSVILPLILYWTFTLRTLVLLIESFNPCNKIMLHMPNEKHSGESQKSVYF